jgi:hypothetical protein
VRRANKENPKSLLSAHEWSKRKLSCALSISIVLFFAPSLQAEIPQAVIDGAKREGKVVFYTTLGVAHSQPLLNSFQKKYPFVQPELFHWVDTTDPVVLGASVIALSSHASHPNAGRLLIEYILSRRAR